MNVVRRNCVGVSRPEILFILSVLLGLASVIVPAMVEFGQRRKSIQAFRDMKVLVSAANQFNREYRLWPVADPPLQGDARFGAGRSNLVILNTLQGIDSSGNEQHRSNPSKINFIDEASGGPSRLKVNERGEVIDPWGSPYEMVFDSNYDSICTVEDNLYDPVIGEGVLVWSSGPDRKSETIDDLRSWTP